MGNYNDIRNIIQTFSGTERHITIPKVYLELTGDFNTAALLNQLVFWSDKTKRPDGFFYKTYKEWEEEICLSQYQVSRAIKNLKTMRIVETKLKKAGGSPTLHYKVDMEVLSQSIIKKLDNRKSRNLINDNEVSSYSLTVDETVDDTVDDNNIVNKSGNPTTLPYKEIVDYLNATASKQYRHSTDKTKKLIQARYKEGFDINDFKKVIDIKTKEWKDDVEMNQYLRPETLFGTKFEGYLNQTEQVNSEYYELNKEALAESAAKREADAESGYLPF